MCCWHRASPLCIWHHICILWLISPQSGCNLTPYQFLYHLNSIPVFVSDCLHSRFCINFSPFQFCITLSPLQFLYHLDTIPDFISLCLHSNNFYHSDSIPVFVSPIIHSSYCITLNPIQFLYHPYSIPVFVSL